ncbi:endonuclease YncB(thermonuclease family) [Variovorax paradoxus]|nr:endonuclease YncB(thermonuclease family) [Variovorax paradoxus]
MRSVPACMRFRPVFSLLLFAFVSLPLLARAEPRSCLVVGISDGDTLTARCGRAGSYEQIKVRIAAIDAPESRQPYGQRSRQALSRLCHAVEAQITPRDTDRYGRTVADVACNGEDAATRMVSGGWAWVYDYDGIATRRGGGLFKLQDAARAQGLGLWADSKPTPPWDWRRERREHHWSDAFF